MQIAILSRGPRLYSTRRLCEAGAERGHEMRVLDPLRFTVFVDQGGPDLFYRGVQLGELDAVIPRIGASITFFGCAVVRQFEQMGVFCVSSANSIAVARDKLRSTQILSRHDLGLATTAFVRQPEDVLPAIERVGGGAPVIIKLLEGTQGVGVILADSPKVAQAIVETLQSAKQNALIQAFVKESRGRDIRALVVGDRVVAAMRRVAQGDEFRSNVHRGGRSEPLQLEPQYERAAIRAAQVLGLRVAGVDMLETHSGPKIMEVNSSPGLEAIEATTKVDVAGSIVELIEQEVQFPEIDLRQRLTLSAGYGVIELRVDEGSELAGRTLGEARLRDREVMILSLQRPGLVVPNPKGDRQVLPGDVLLCYGKMTTLRGLARGQVPARRGRPRPAVRSGAEEERSA